MRVLIAGCGDVGTQLGLLLSETGAEVWGLRRGAHSLPSPIRPIPANLLSPDLAKDLPAVDHVVYAASADESTPEGYRAAYLLGVRNLLDALAQSGSAIRRLLFLSSTAVYGEARGGWVDEATPPLPDGFRGEILLSGEESILNAPGVQSRVILRLAGIYGPTRTGLVERVRSGNARCPEGEIRWSNRIHRDDAAGAACHLLLHDEPESIYIGVDSEPASICEVYRFVAHELGVPAPEPVLPSDSAHLGKRCSNRRLLSSGYTLLFPDFRAGYHAALSGSDDRSLT